MNERRDDANEREDANPCIDCYDKRLHGERRQKWKCESRRSPYDGRECEYTCTVEADFEPRGCLKYAAWQTWTKVD